MDRIGPSIIPARAHVRVVCACHHLCPTLTSLMISLSGISALISYYYTLWLTPSLSVSLLIWIYQSPRLLVAYKAYKATLRVLLRRSGELDRVLASDGHSYSSDGHIRLKDTDDDDAETIQGPSDDDAAAKGDIDGTSSAAVLHGDDNPVSRAVTVDNKASRDWRVCEAEI